MNNKMAKNTDLSTNESKNKLSKQEQKQNNGHGESFDGYWMGRGFGAMGEELWELRSTNWQLQNSHWDEKYNIGNGVAKELICMTHGQEQR